MSNGEKLRLLVIEESSNDAESLANELRNAGHTIDLSHAQDTMSLEAALDNQQPDILICGSGSGLPDAASVATTIGKRHLSTPIIAIADEASETAVVTARKAGIAALVSYDHPEHLHAVFKHEAEVVELQHKLNAFTASLQASEKRCHALIENSSDAIAYLHEGMHLYANKPYMDLFSIKTKDDIAGIPVLDMVSSSQRDTFKNFLNGYQNNSDAGNMLTIDCVCPDGELFNSSMEFSPATMDGEHCTQIIIRVNSSDNSALKEKIKTLSQKDMLTGLWNRQHFMRLLGDQVNRDDADEQQRALVYLTLDNFKVIREEAGIAASDLVLCDIAHLIENKQGENNLLSRFGDYSFVMLTQDTDIGMLQSSCEELLRDIAGHLTEIEGRAFTMTASLGICAINHPTDDVQKIISYADMACEVARTSGGNQAHTHSTVVEDSLNPEQEDNWDQVIRDTIDNERFYLVYQPIVSLKGDTSEHYEVLLRIIDADGHVILPGQFLSIAGRTGLALDIDRWVFNKAFSVLAEARKENNVSFYIKVSESTLTDPASADWIKDKLQEFQIDSKSVIFEISESYAINNLSNAKEFINSLHAIDCKVALEHFGLSDQPQLLQHIPADILKIDGSLINGLSSEKDIQSKVRSLTEFARDNEKICIAERVDDANALALLWQYGVDYIQGYFVQEPDKELGYEFESELV